MGLTPLDQLLAKQDITESLYRYCRALDRMDLALAHSVWHDNATVDYGEYFQGSAEAFIIWVWDSHKAMASHSHQISNVLIELSGNAARSEAYVTVGMRRILPSGCAMDTTNRGRYLDRWSRHDGVWLIDDRHFVRDFRSTYPKASAATSASSAGWGFRDTGDPSYLFLRN